jgi:hypothetical protein
MSCLDVAAVSEGAGEWNVYAVVVIAGRHIDVGEQQAAGCHAGQCPVAWQGVVMPEDVNPSC